MKISKSLNKTTLVEKIMASKAAAAAPMEAAETAIGVAVTDNHGESMSYPAPKKRGRKPKEIYPVVDAAIAPAKDAAYHCVAPAEVAAEEPDAAALGLSVPEPVVDEQPAAEVPEEGNDCCAPQEAHHGSDCMEVPQTPWGPGHVVHCMDSSEDERLGKSRYDIIRDILRVLEEDGVTYREATLILGDTQEILEHLPFCVSGVEAGLLESIFEDCGVLYD